MYGLLEQDFEYIIKAMKQFDEIESAIIFGSRAMGNYKKGSDIDLALCGEKITNRILFEVNDLLNEVYPLPYFFDIIHYEKINNEKLIEHIQTHGKVLYVRDGNQLNSKYLAK